jgi:uncharacterized lipoprotein YehR (DUF1307 family)
LVNNSYIRGYSYIFIAVKDELGGKQMKKIILSLITVIMLLTVAGCGQWSARKFGGDYTYELPKGEKLINVTWKEDSLWYLTRPMRDSEEPDTYKFKADSVFGVFEGTVTIVETE